MKCSDMIIRYIQMAESVVFTAEFSIFSWVSALSLLRCPFASIYPLPSLDLEARCAPGQTNHTDTDTQIDSETHVNTHTDRHQDTPTHTKTHTHTYRHKHTIKHTVSPTDDTLKQNRPREKQKSTQQILFRTPTH